VNSVYGTRMAVLTGDYLFAQSSWFLANLDNLEVRAARSLSLWGGGRDVCESEFVYAHARAKARHCLNTIMSRECHTCTLDTYLRKGLSFFQACCLYRPVNGKVTFACAFFTLMATHRAYAYARECHACTLDRCLRKGILKINMCDLQTCSICRHAVLADMWFSYVRCVHELADVEWTPCFILYVSTHAHTCGYCPSGATSFACVQVIKLISQVIADFANGEISQAASLFDTDITFEV
jgi:hypothetical protein